MRWIVWIASVWGAPAHAEPVASSAAPERSVEDPLEEILSREASILALVLANAPDQHAELLALKRTDRLGYVRELVRLGRALSNSRQDPEAVARWFAIRGKMQQLDRMARTFRGLPEEERAAHRAAIVEIASGLMELKQADRRARVAEIRARLETLQAEIEAREAQREEIIEEYVGQLLSESVEL